MKRLLSSVLLASVMACGGDDSLAPPGLDPVGVYELRSIDSEELGPWLHFQSPGELDGEEVLVLTDFFGSTLELRPAGTLNHVYYVRELLFDPFNGDLLEERTWTLTWAEGVWSLNGNLVTLRWEEDGERPVWSCAGRAPDVFTLSVDSRRLTGGLCGSARVFVYVKR